MLDTKTLYTVDDEFSKALAESLIKAERGRARNQQKELGPSAIGMCREKLRMMLFEGYTEEPHGEPQWNAASTIGTLLGDHAQTAYAKDHGGQTEVRITTKFPCGLTISGNSDCISPEENRLVDLKSKAWVSDASKWGPSFVYLAQIVTYLVGAVQGGILKPGAKATLAYLGRAGQDPMPWSVTIAWEKALELFEELNARFEQVFEAQREIVKARKAGDEDEVLAIRRRFVAETQDCSPAYALAVGCPCAEVAEWTVQDLITDEEVIHAAHDYEEAKKEAEGWAAKQKKLREDLRGWAGVLPDGTRIFWNSRGALTVRKPKVQKDPTV